jgi:molecular chaperone GrpE
MIDEEKQPDNNSQQTNEPIKMNQESIGAQESAANETDATQEAESPLGLEEPAAESAEGAQGSLEPEAEAAAAGSPSADSAARNEEELANLEAMRQENEALKAQLAEISQNYDALKSQSVRIAADFDNFRKRTTKEKEELEHKIKRIAINELLPVVDNFERARSQIKPQSDGEMTIHKSYQGVYKQLVDCLKRIGVSAMRPEGQEFDPNLHEAVMRQPTSEYPEGVVIEQLVRGYMLGDRVLRHAMVKVATAPEPSGEDAEAESESASE